MHLQPILNYVRNPCRSWAGDILSKVFKLQYYHLLLTYELHYQIMLILTKG